MAVNLCLGSDILKTNQNHAEDLLYSGKFSDIEIELDNFTSGIPAHKFMLSLVCEREDLENISKMKISGVSKDAMCSFLELIYTGKCECSEESSKMIKVLFEQLGTWKKFETYLTNIAYGDENESFISYQNKNLEKTLSAKSEILKSGKTKEAEEVKSNEGIKSKKSIENSENDESKDKLQNISLSTTNLFENEIEKLIFMADLNQNSSFSPNYDTLESKGKEDVPYSTNNSILPTKGLSEVKYEVKMEETEESFEGRQNKLHEMFGISNDVKTKSSVKEKPYNYRNIWSSTDRKLFSKIESSLDETGPERDNEELSLSNNLILPIEKQDEISYKVNDQTDDAFDLSQNELDGIFETPKTLTAKRGANRTTILDGKIIKFRDIGFACPASSCRKIYDVKTSLREHFYKAHKNEDWNIYKQIYKTLPDIKWHAMEQHPWMVVKYQRAIQSYGNAGEKYGKLFQCFACNSQPVSSLLALKIHVEKHHDKEALNDFEMLNKTPYLCPDCYYSFSQASDLAQHVYNVHDTSNKEQHQCENCGKDFKTPKGLRDHIKLVHEGQNRTKPYSCNQCDETFKSRRRRDAHINKHSGLRPYTCTECIGTFLSKEYLQKHIKERHSNYTMKFRCDQCAHFFKDKNKLTSHIKVVHLNIREFMCEICNWASSCRGNLNKHMKNKHKIQK